MPPRASEHARRDHAGLDADIDPTVPSTADTEGGPERGRHDRDQHPEATHGRPHGPVESARADRGTLEAGPHEENAATTPRMSAKLCVRAVMIPMTTRSTRSARSLLPGGASRSPSSSGESSKASGVTTLRGSRGVDVAGMVPGDYLRRAQTRSASPAAAPRSAPPRSAPGPGPGSIESARALARERARLSSSLPTPGAK
jgi:hypothetical protein